MTYSNKNVLNVNKIVRIFLKFYASLLCNVAFSEKITQPRISGGINCDIMDHTYYVLILKVDVAQQRYTTSCGGSLMSARWVLTAGSCCLDTDDNFDVIPLKIIAGAQKAFRILNDGNITMDARYIANAKEIIIHPEYQNISYEHNICVLYLDVDIPKVLGQISYVKLYTNPTHMDTLPCNSGMTLGFGYQNQFDRYGNIVEENKLYKTNLQCVNLRLYQGKECAKLHMSKIKEATNFCVVGKYGAQGPCYRDQGGPVMCDDKQVGILSMVRSCGISDEANPVVRVDAYMDFIRHSYREGEKFRSCTSIVRVFPIPLPIMLGMKVFMY